MGNTVDNVHMQAHPGGPQWKGKSQPSVPLFLGDGDGRTVLTWLHVCFYQEG